MLKIMTGILFALVSCQIFAATDCTVKGGTHVINYGDIIVQRDLAIGQPIGNVINGTEQLDYSCTVTNGGGVFSAIKSYLTFSGQTDGNIKIFKTNLDGVGIEIGGAGSSAAASSNGCYISEGCYYGWSYPDWQAITGYSNNGDGTSDLTVKPYIKLVKIASVTPGQLTGQLASVMAGEKNLSGTPTGKWYPEIPVTFGSGKITVVACTLKTPSLNFPIGDILASQFGTTVGTIPAGGQNTQNLGLDCDADANINVSLSGTQNPDVTTDSVLALTGQGNSDVAKGVGVQLLYNNTPLKLNNNIVLKKSTGGQETFPIVARYYQTKTSVTTGKANASATLNLTYQ